MQENHSFDNYFGTYPGADGIPTGVCMPINPERPQAKCVEPFHLGGRAVPICPRPRHPPDPIPDGRMDGFVDGRPGPADQARASVMGYYDDRDMPFYWNVADDYVLFDRFFAAVRRRQRAEPMYWVTGTPGSRRPGYAERASATCRRSSTGSRSAGSRGSSTSRITTPHLPQPRRAGGAQVNWCRCSTTRASTTRRCSSHIVDLEQYYDDLRARDLPAVSYIVPAGASEHPPGSLEAGQRFVRKLVNALIRSTAWERSAFMWTYDDWGGWYDHVGRRRSTSWLRLPGARPAGQPLRPRGYVDSTPLDSTSILRFIERNWGFDPLA